MKMSILFEFIPIIIVVLFLLYTKNMIEFSNTLLGKLIAVMIIVFYSSVDILYGAIVCGLTIIYYTHSHIEGMDTYCHKKDNQKNEECGVESFDTNDDIATLEFKEKNCQREQLTYKQSDVRTEMAEHIFPEIQYKHTRCNPCDSACYYSIIASKVRQEDSMQTPKNSDEDNTWMSIYHAITADPLKSIGVVSEPFSFYDNKK